MEEIKLEVSLLDQNSKNYLSNELKKWYHQNNLFIGLIEINVIEDTSYLDNLIERIKEIIDDEPFVYTPPISNYPDGRKYTPPSDEEFYEMLK